MPAPPKQLGTYATPAFDYGDVVECARRGDVRIVDRLALGVHFSFIFPLEGACPAR